MKPETIKAIDFILSKGDRVELIPTKDGVKVVRIRREPMKIDMEKPVNLVKSLFEAYENFPAK